MRKIFTIVIVALSINAFAQIPTNGLIGYWPFNGNANDESVNSNNGTVHGATLTTDRFGNLNSAYIFNGIDNYIAIPNSTIFDLNKFTISLWVKLSIYTPPQTPDVFIFNKGDGATGISWRIYHQGVMPNDSASIVNDIFTPTRYDNYKTIVSDRWCNIIFINDNSQIMTYIDGNLVSTKAITGSTIISNNEIMIGGRLQSNSVQGFYKGIIDDIRMYNRDLEDSEIIALYNESLCFETITVTDTLIINANLTGYNPITYENTIKVFPNPTFDAITIDCGSNFSTLNGYTIKIMNSLSQTVYTSLVTQQSTVIDLNSWTGAGIYFVHLIDASNNTIDIKKIVLQ